MNETFTGRVWTLGDDIDTDIIIPTEYLALKTVQDMAPYAFSPLRPGLAAQIRPGDLIVAGKNFGCGSSREQAPEIIKALGILCPHLLPERHQQRPAPDRERRSSGCGIRRRYRRGPGEREDYPQRKRLRHRVASAEPGGHHRRRRTGKSHAPSERTGGLTQLWD